MEVPRDQRTFAVSYDVQVGYRYGRWSRSKESIIGTGRTRQTGRTGSVELRLYRYSCFVESRPGWPNAGLVETRPDYSENIILLYEWVLIMNSTMS